MLMVGEAELRRRFGYALQRAIEARDTSERQLSIKLGIDARKIARWRSGGGLPDLYQTQALIDALRVKEELFKNPPEVPEQPAYPIEDYLLDDVVERAAGVAVDESRHKPSGDADPEPEPMGNAGPQAPQPDRGR